MQPILLFKLKAEHRKNFQIVIVGHFLREKTLKKDKSCIKSQKKRT